MVANEGWKLLPHYRFEPTSGLWHHRAGRPDPAMRLSDLTYRSGKLEYRSRHVTEPEHVLAGYLEDAKRILGDAVKEATDADAPRLSEDFESLRWFTLPSEAVAELRGEGEVRPHPQPIHLR
jgi:hypothetical protein